MAEFEPFDQSTQFLGSHRGHVSLNNRDDMSLMLVPMAMRNHNSAARDAPIELNDY